MNPDQTCFGCYVCRYYRVLRTVGGDFQAINNDHVRELRPHRESDIDTKSIIKIASELCLTHFEVLQVPTSSCVPIYVEINGF